MASESDFQPDVDIAVQSVLLAASQHDIPTLKRLLQGESAAPANVQDPETGLTPLHAAIAACEAEVTNSSQMNGHTPLENEEETELRAGVSQATESEYEEFSDAEDTLQLLLENGAIWNELDKNDETPGCIAYRLKLWPLYRIMVTAGVRAEMLLTHLDNYERLDDEDTDEIGLQEAGSSTADLLDAPASSNFEVDNAIYLMSSLSLTSDWLIDADANGVMMSWETDIMKRTADLIIPNEGLRILNIGHGMGIIDEFFVAKSPATHHIIEAHPDVISNMRQNGWGEKPGVIIHEGKWQDIVPELMKIGTTYDAVFFDTFAEDYKDLRNFFQAHLIEILDDNGKFSFFNGLGADRQISYDIYGKIVEMDLLEASYILEWETIKVRPLSESGTWNGLKRPYWKLEEYRLPIVTLDL